MGPEEVRHGTSPRGTIGRRPCPPNLSDTVFVGKGMYQGTQGKGNTVPRALEAKEEERMVRKGEPEKGRAKAKATPTGGATIVESGATPRIGAPGRACRECSLVRAEDRARATEDTPQTTKNRRRPLRTLG